MNDGLRENSIEPFDPSARLRTGKAQGERLNT